jgi:hypothetical protein
MSFLILGATTKFLIIIIIPHIVKIEKLYLKVVFSAKIFPRHIHL